MKIKAFFSDYLGILSAVLCLVHCLVAPAFMGAYAHAHDHLHVGGFGSVGNVEHSSSILLHPSWDFFFLGLGFVAVLFSSKHSPNLMLKLLLWLTYGFLVGAIFLEGAGSFFQNLVYISSLALIVVHVLNIRHWWRHAKRTPHMSPSK